MVIACLPLFTSHVTSHDHLNYIPTRQIIRILIRLLEAPLMLAEHCETLVLAGKLYDIFHVYYQFLYTAGSPAIIR
jgi:hypothetical protein